MRPDLLAAWQAYDATARALPGCEHNAAWRLLGRGRPQPPDCEHNRAWRAEVAAAWRLHLAALDGLPAVGARAAQDALW